MKVVETWAKQYLQTHPDVTCVRVGVDHGSRPKRVWVDVLGVTRGSMKLKDPSSLPPIPSDVEAEALLRIMDFDDFENIPASIIGGSAKTKDPNLLSFNGNLSVLTARSSWVGFRTFSASRMPHE